MTDEANIICPECEHENKPDAKRCTKCNYPLAADKDFDRLVAARKKRAAAAKNQNQPEEKEGFFDVLG